MNNKVRFKFRKEERLTGKKSIDILFKKGIHINKHPLHAIYNVINDQQKYPIRVLFGVSKKKFKRAVKRNLVRRRLREAYRLNKHLIYNSLNILGKKIHLGILYEGSEIVDYKVIESKMKEIFNELILQVEDKNFEGI